MGLQSERISGKMRLQSERISGKMGLASGNIYLGSLSSRRFHDRIKKVENDQNVAETGSRCWTKLRFLGCISQRSKVEGSISDSNSQNEENKSSKEVSIEQPVTTIISSTTTSNATGSMPTTPNVLEELKIASQLRKFSFHELRLATRSFKADNLLGEGGFGCVFKGWVSENGSAPVKPGSGLTVAIKTLNHDGLQGHREWLAEVSYLGDLHHPNLVNLIGYCIEGDQRVLVYEFMPRGSLENHLFRRSLPLPWSVRIKVALGAAMGLAFLHEEAERPVIYRDFKASNILLDAEYNAKLSDFGLAKDAPEGDKTHVSTRVMGTYGYAAPEYVMTGHLTSKSDVYSFGVVLLEIITGRRSMDKNRPIGEQNLVEWAKPYLNDRRRVYRLLDPRLQGRFSIEGAHKAVHLAARCLCRDAKTRPLMSEIVEKLKPLPDLNDMACSSSSFLRSIQSDRTTSVRNRGSGDNNNKMQAVAGQGSLSFRNGSLKQLFNSSNGQHVSPYHPDYPLRSSKREG